MISRSVIALNLYSSILTILLILMSKNMKNSDRFLDNLVSYGLGHLVDDLANEQNRIVDAVRETGKSGSLTISFKFKRSREKLRLI